MGGMTDFGLVDEPAGEHMHVVVPTGEIDALTAPTLGRRLLRLADEGKTGLVVDLSGVTLVDSFAIGVLLNAVRSLSSRSVELAIVCPTERVARPFEVTGLRSRLPVCGSREAALQRLAAPAPA
jgi:anti-sigma B factor antagonist